MCPQSNPEYSTFAFEFRRRNAEGNSSPTDGEKASKPPVVEVLYGPDWYTNAGYDGPKAFPAPEEYTAYTGHYRSDSAWGGDARVFVQKDKLTLSGSPLMPIGNGLFRSGDAPWSPDTVEFHSVVEGKARLLKFAGMDFWRIEVD